MKNKFQKGQATIEFALASIFFLTVIILGIFLISDFYGKNILIKWAAFNSRCLAIESAFCKNTTTKELGRYFGFKNITINEYLKRGIWHSTISATYLGRQLIISGYDLGPSEYKRTHHE